jgi:3-hydroxymyristoyl/3-hydroxydecanoyl-(acyl carrier protein) dehydratase
MVPVAEFDDPQALRERFALLRADGVPPGGFGGLPALDLQRGDGEHSQRTRATLRVPTQASFFTDHFPRRPVFPGTLLMHCNLQTAAWLAAEVPAQDGAAWVPRVVSEVKLRTFIAPGDTLSLEARRTGNTSDGSLGVAVETRLQERRIGSAQIEFIQEVRP